MSTANEILAAHRLPQHARKSVYTTTCPQCSHARRKKRQKCLSVLIDGRGIRAHCHHCQWTLVEFFDGPKAPVAASNPTVVINEKGDDDRARIKRAREIWSQAIDPRGTVVEAYLANRGLRLLGNIADRVVRFHATCPWKDDRDKLIRVPAMITAMVDIRTNQLRAVQRTRLTPDGTRIARKFTGVAAGTAIKLSVDDAVTMGLGVTEGLENALAVMLQGWHPVWALGSDKGIADLPILSGIECLTIFGDNDRED